MLKFTSTDMQLIGEFTMTTDGMEGGSYRPLQPGNEAKMSLRKKK